MKAFLKTLIVVLALGILFTGCKKAKEVEPNYFQVTSDTTYALSGGILYYYGTGTWSGYGFQVCLISENLVVDESDDWSGSGDFFLLELSSSVSTGIASGTYTYQLFDDLTENHFDEYTFWETGWNTTSEAYAYLTSGTLVVVNKGDDNYEFTFNGTDGAGNSVKAHYDGSIDYTFDYSKKSASTGNILTPVNAFGASR